MIVYLDVYAIANNALFLFLLVYVHKPIWTSFGLIGCPFNPSYCNKRCALLIFFILAIFLSDEDTIEILYCFALQML